MHPEFGIRTDEKGKPLIDINEKLITALRVAPQLKSSDVKLFMLEAYETTFGIYNHDMPDPERPLASVAMHHAENMTEGSLLFERINVFAAKRVHKHFGISLNEFFDLPRDICEEVLKISAKLTAMENNATNAINKQFDDISGQPK